MVDDEATVIRRSTMASLQEKKALAKAYQDKALDTWSPVNWRAWGSWWGWGSATGLGIFFVLTAFAVWILFHL